MGGGVVEFLDLVVKGDTGDLGDARDGAADHEDDPEFTERVGETQREAGGDATPRERSVEPEKNPKRPGTEGGAGVEQLARHAAQRGLERLHGKRQGIKDGGDDQAGETENERLAGEIEPPTARRVLWGKTNEDVETDDGGRKDDRERDERFEERRDARAGGVEPMGEGQTDDTEDQSGDRGEAQRETKRLPERRRETEERGGGVGQVGGTLNAQRLTLNAE